MVVALLHKIMLLLRDGLLYTIRDVTDTIDGNTDNCVNRFKKATEGLGALVLDVKCGSAAFMQNMADAEELATSMVKAAGLSISYRYQITQMDYPSVNTSATVWRFRVD